MKTENLRTANYIKISHCLRWPLKRRLKRLFADAPIVTLMMATMMFASISSAYAQCGLGNENPLAASTTPATKFAEQPDGIVLHRPTGRIWQRCALGQTWDNTTCIGTPQLLSWSDALIEANNHEQAGFDDWRVPDRNELASIIEMRCFVPAVNVLIFPATSPSPYWTGSPVADVTDEAWVIDFADGLVQPGTISALYSVRLVRGRSE